MAWFPKAVKKDIRPGSNDPAIDVIGAILHVDAGNNESLYDYFKHRSGGIESHFHIRKDGTVEQYRDTGFEADANYKANSFMSGGRRKGYVSIETQGHGHGEWTDAQLASIKELLAWLAEKHDFPLQKCDTPVTPGVGYHTLYPWIWTPVAKSCPGPERIAQFENVLVPWMRHGDKKSEPVKRPKKKRKLSRGRRIDGAIRFIRGAKAVATRKKQKNRVAILSAAEKTLLRIKGK